MENFIVLSLFSFKPVVECACTLFIVSQYCGLTCDAYILFLAIYYLYFDGSW